MKKFEFTNEEVEVLKTRAGMMALLTDDDVEKLKKGEADEHTVYWVEKKLSYWRQQKRAEEKQQERQMRQPITRIELLNFAGQHLVTKQSLKEVVLRQEAVIRLIGERFGKSSAENWFTDENIVKARKRRFWQKLDFLWLKSMRIRFAVVASLRQKAASRADDAYRSHTAIRPAY